MLIVLDSWILTLFNYYRLHLICSVGGASNVLWFPAGIYTWIVRTFLIPRNPNFLSSIQCHRTPFPVLMPIFGISLDKFPLPVQLIPTKWGQIPMYSYFTPLLDTPLPHLHVPLLKWCLPHMMSLVHCQLCIHILWLGARGCNGDAIWVPGGVVHSGGFVSEGVRSIWYCIYTTWKSVHTDCSSLCMHEQVLPLHPLLL